MNDLHVASLRASTEFPLGFAPLGHSSPSFGSRQVCSHSNPSQKIKVGRRCTPQGDTTNQLPYALRVYSPVDSPTCQTPWSVFQDGWNGEATGQRPERADAKAHRMARAACHNRGDGIQRAYREPGLWPPPPQSTLVHAPSRSADRLVATAPRGAIGSGHNGALTLSVPPSRGLGPGLPLRTLLQTTIRTTVPPDSKAGLFPRVIPPDLGSWSERCERKEGPGVRTRYGLQPRQHESWVTTTTCRDVRRRGPVFRPAASSRRTGGQYPPRNTAASRRAGAACGGEATRDAQADVPSA
ncbi:hypothetical protein RND71_023357 [Anisodus tanguticus]|uniref:Uncharacterized protein n=1 Tax=Anisodus tanguticus TaxID=243964 RepID=A0AAE1RUP7_9SOLA|nr:hypothetical protein RND71_023357 [Anisodus tanguticus]